MSFFCDLDSEVHWESVWFSYWCRVLQNVCVYVFAAEGMMKKQKPNK